MCFISSLTVSRFSPGMVLLSNSIDNILYSKADFLSTKIEDFFTALSETLEPEADTSLQQEPATAPTGL